MTKSSTEVLRRLLDERGVEWERGLPTETIVREPIDALYVERPDGRMHVYFRSYLAPEQAIAATLGRGTCHIETHFGEWYCTGCGVMVGTCDPDSELCVDGNYVSLWNYCPNCGRRVVDPTTNDVDAEVDE